jgi:hypothetical protein
VPGPLLAALVTRSGAAMAGGGKSARDQRHRGGVERLRVGNGIWVPQKRLFLMAAIPI